MNNSSTFYLLNKMLDFDIVKVDILELLIILLLKMCPKNWNSYLVVLTFEYIYFMS